MNKKIRKCQILADIRHLHLALGEKALKSYVSNGIDAVGLVRPTNVIARVSRPDSGLGGEYSHDRFILKVIVRGRIRMMIGGKPFVLKAGDGIVVFPFQTHSSQKLESYAGPYQFVGVTFDLAPEEFARLRVLKDRIFRISRQDERALLRVVAGFQKKNNIGPAEAVWELSGFLMRQTIALTRGDFPLWPTDVSSRFQTICDFIRTHLNERVTIGALARRLGVSRETVHADFRKYFKSLTPAALGRQLRLQTAQERLERTDDPVSQISDSLGYSTPFIFSNAFKHRYGLSPLHYRKRYRGS